MIYVYHVHVETSRINTIELKWAIEIVGTYARDNVSRILDNGFVRTDI